MPTFFDDFARANGALGNDWVTTQGTVVVQSQGAYVSLAGEGAAQWRGASDADYHYAEAHVLHFVGNTNWIGPAVKMTSGMGAYQAFVRTQSGVHTFYLAVQSGASRTTLASQQLSANIPMYYTVTLEWNLGHLTAVWNDSVTLEANNADLAAGLYAGLASLGPGPTLADIKLILGSPETLTAEPSVIGNYGACVPVTLTGVGTAWTPGTPGSPAFTVNHGTISEQTVTDETHATLTYCPGDYLGSVTFTDPTTGTSAGAVVTSDPGVVPPSGDYQFTPQAVAMVNNTAGESWLETLTKPSTPVAVDAGAELSLDTVLGRIALNTGATVDPVNLPDATLLYTLYRLLNGGVPSPAGPFPAPTFATVDAGLATLDTRLADMITSNNYTLGDVIVQLAGLGVPTIRDVLDALSGLSAPDLTAVLDRLDEIQGAGGVTLQAIGGTIGDLRTVSSYDLQDVHDWIDAVSVGSTDLSPVLTAISNLDTHLTNSTTAIQNNIAGLGIVLTALQTLSTSIEGTVGTVAEVATDVLDIVTSLRDRPSAATPPIWPGIDGVDLGETISVTQAHRFDGDCDGILLAIIAESVRQPTMIIGPTKLYRTMGRVAFISDSGETEAWQPIPSAACVMVPRTLLHASGFIVGFYHVVDAGVTPWNLKAL